MSSNQSFNVEDSDTKIIIESDGAVIIGDLFGNFSCKITPREFDSLARARRERMQADNQKIAEYLEYQLDWYIEGKFTRTGDLKAIERFIAWLKSLDIQQVQTKLR